MKAGTTKDLVTEMGRFTGQQNGGRRPLKAHPFLPGGWQSPAFLVWLRRCHGWLGIWGAVAGILFGVTTVLMVHSDVFPPAEDEQSIVQLPVNDAVIDSADSLGAFAKAELGLTTDWGAPRGRGGAAGAAALGSAGIAMMSGVEPHGGLTGGERSRQPVYSTQFTSPGRTLDMRFVAGNEYIEITRTERGFMQTINRLHRGNGAQLGWTLLGDAFSGALIVLAISGVLLWSRMDGSRLIAIGLGGAGLLCAVYFGMVGA